ncbi:MAG: hypothetical protein IPO58_16830 [Betaproteobacteria bacterium]|nr:hypothetical protein [Betaproteobacteria bacterium]
MPFGSWLAVVVLRIVARLPFRWLHKIGAAGGRLVYARSAGMRARIVDNVRGARIAGESDIAVERFARACAVELGKGMMEILPLWFGRVEDMMTRVRLDATWDAVQPLFAAGKGVMFLTSHLGAFEVAGQFLAQNMKITIMYRRPRIAWLDPVLRHARAQGQARLTTADTRGVRALLQALKKGKRSASCPTRCPRKAMGSWPTFSGAPPIRQR